MRVNYCVRCGLAFDFEKVSRTVSCVIEPGQLKPKIREEYNYQCHSCEHYQYVVDTNYESVIE